MNGGCSLMVERVVVASDFAKLPIALDLERGQEQSDFALCGITGKIRKTRVQFSPSALERSERGATRDYSSSALGEKRK